ncbi:MAG TPA: sodium ion-translocating decarboxylase subunit beta [Dissulfurispiraceae bacterium]|nr:sodium ion-translocating decarboxylase subunit beta [Dissulfurispiraceae bacterium]
MKKLCSVLLGSLLLIGVLGLCAGLSGSMLHAAHGPDTPKAASAAKGDEEVSIERSVINLAKTTGFYGFLADKETVKFRGGDVTVYGWHKLMMLIIGGILLYLGAAKNFEPLLLVPIGFGTVLVNIPFAGMGDDGGFLKIIFDFGINNEFFPLVIFMGIGALTDFGPLIANPRTALLGAAAQFGVFGTLLGAVALNIIPGITYTLKEACAISIIGGADGPTSIYLAGKLAPDLMGSIAVAAYSYMALVPLIQPPIMRALTTPEERKIRMKQLRPVSKVEKIIFPMLLLVLTILLLPTAAPLIGSIAFGNFVREIGVVDRLSKTMQNELLNIVTIFLGLGVGTQMVAYKFIQPATLGIVVLGLVAFCFGSAAGVIFAKIMNRFVKDKINPLIGSAGVSAVPMAARVSNKLGLEADSSNFLIMHAMGPNVAGVIGTAVAAGVMIAIFGN